MLHSRRATRSQTLARWAAHSVRTGPQAKLPGTAEMDAFERDHPQWGMPYQFPALPNDEMQVLQRWLDQGRTAGHSPAPLPSAIQHQVSQWETFLNGTSPKERLVARYLYEHLFQAHLHFRRGRATVLSPGACRTPPGQTRGAPWPRAAPPTTPVPPVLPARTRARKPGGQEPHALCPGAAAPGALAPAPAGGTTVQHLPGYSDDVASNPFVVFQDIPAATRYRFAGRGGILRHGLHQRPVCRGQVALNVIEDHFWSSTTIGSTPTAKAWTNCCASKPQPGAARRAKQPGRFQPLDGLRAARARLPYRPRPHTWHKSEEGRIDLNLIWDGEATTPTPH